MHMADLNATLPQKTSMLMHKFHSSTTLVELAAPTLTISAITTILKPPVVALTTPVTPWPASWLLLTTPMLLQAAVALSWIHSVPLASDRPYRMLLVGCRHEPKAMCVRNAVTTGERTSESRDCTVPTSSYKDLETNVRGC